MQSRATWARCLEQESQRLGFEEGYKLLYCPWATIGQADTVFLSLNPGVAPQGADLRTVSDERGNSYEVERHTTQSPITTQFLALAELLRTRPSRILTGVVAPFRSASWGTVATEARTTGLDIGRQFWGEVFAVRRPRLVLASSREAERLVTDLLGAEIEQEIPSGWGSVTLRRSRSRNGSIVVGLPQLSRFKLLSRPACREQLMLALSV